MRFHTKKKPQPWEAGALAVARTHIGTWDRRPVNNYKDSHQKRRPDYFIGQRRSISLRICSAHRIESDIALIVAGTLAVPLYCASFRAARIAGARCGCKQAFHRLPGRPGAGVAPARCWCN